MTLSHAPKLVRDRVRVSVSVRVRVKG